MKIELPTKTGIYYWRENDGDDWEFRAITSFPTKNSVLYKTFNDEPDWPNGFNSVSVITKGQWLSIPTAEELVELKELKKRVDEGAKAWAVYDPNGKLYDSNGDGGCIDIDPCRCWMPFVEDCVEGSTLEDYRNKERELKEEGYSCKQVILMRKVEG